ncbi:MAG: DUF2868 domain-containing protein [Chromatiaceae bacterium]|nr:DUF2868 domain-containing protein [Chromatiaceae bacterium]
MDPRPPEFAPVSPAGGPRPGPDDRWTVPDLIDFEYYLERDEIDLRERPAARVALADRDRAIYLDGVAPALAGLDPHSPSHRRGSLRRWLTARRESEPPDLRDLLPGTAFDHAQRLGTLILAVAGFLIGVGAASTLLSYDGRLPVNVSWYLFLLVGAQFLLIGGGVLAWVLRRSRPVGATIQDVTVLGRLIRPLFTRLGSWVQQQRLAHASQEARDRARAGTGMLKSQYQLYGPVTYLPVLVPAQVFGVAFNLGVILTTIAMEWFTDLAFGWGSALDVGPQAVYELARAVATPWSWLLGEGVGYPTLDQVAGSRINLKDPLFLLDAGHLRSWRWFLVLAVITYGLLPRLVLLLASIYAQRHLLSRLPFTHARTQALYARLVTPRLETPGGSGQGPAMPIPAPLVPRVHRQPRPERKPQAQPEPTPRPESPQPEPEPRLAPRPELQPPLTPRSKEERKPTPQPRPQLEPTPQPEPQLEPRLQPRPEPWLQPQLEPTPRSKPPLESARQPQPGPVLQPGSRLQPGPTGQPQPQSVPPLQPQPQPQPQSPQPLPESRLESPPEPEPEPRPPPQPPIIGLAGGIAPDACLLLIHVDVDDLIEDQDRPRLAGLIAACTGWRIARAASFGSGTLMTEGVIQWLAEQDWQAPPARVVILMDGSQPPITENLRFLRELRAAAGTQAQLLLALVGDPQDEDPLPPVGDFDFTDWQRKIDALGDPYLRLAMLAPPHADGEP